MTNVEKTRKDAEASYLVRVGSSILGGVPLGINWLPNEDNQLGYTSGVKKKTDKPIINVAWYNANFFEKLEDVKRTMLRMGIFAHELLHQCLTNFDYTNQVIDSMTQAEAAVFMKFANTLEDPAIEYFAPQIFGGTLLEALHFSIQHIYMLSPKIEESKSPFRQLIDALIQFGDKGIIKGNFTYPEAKEYFLKVAPLYNEGIVCPDSKKRIDIAIKVMEITKPLWWPMIKEQEEMNQLIKELMEELQKNGLHLMKEREKQLKSETSDYISNNVRERRNELIEKAENMNDNEENDSVSDDGSEIENLDNSESKGNDISNPTSSEKAIEDNTSSKKTSDNKNEKRKSKTNILEDFDDNSKEGRNQNDSEKWEEQELTTTEEEANKIVEEEYTISAKDLEAIEKEISNEMDKTSKKEFAEKNKDLPLPEYEITSSEFKDATCLNLKMSSEENAERIKNMYQANVNLFRWDIQVLKKTLDRIFKSDMEESCRTTSGSYNIKRGTIRTTARIFDKRRDPANLKNAAIVLAVDSSGSMYGKKIAQARNSAIIFAEALTAIGIPYYIMGFSADTQGYDAIHRHFVDWNNRKVDRESIVSMSANGNNFDGYSIRYASQLLKNRSEQNKILIVISDGEPACMKYSCSSGIADTISAIKDARKICTTVFGIALGKGCSPEILHKMYGKDFIHCPEIMLLTNVLSKKLEKLLKGGNHAKY